MYLEEDRTFDIGYTHILNEKENNILILNELKYKFNDVSKIKHNYSQVFQDLFVLTVLNGKYNGTYLEIGSNDPFYNNNTALLELNYKWKGLSIELDEQLVEKFNIYRSNLAICKNALDINYEKLLDSLSFIDNNIVDYLQVDCDPAHISFNVLEKVISSGYKFKVITFEHDYYLDPSIKQLSRTLLLSQGYTLLVNDVSFNDKNSFEDWWILKDYTTNLHVFNNLNSNVNSAFNLFF